MRYCTRCVIPTSKPHIVFDEDGICTACRAHERKNAALGGIDWAERARAFEVLIEQARAVKAPWFDVLVPVSGGKDSITQVHRVLGRNLRILAVNVDYGMKTEIGRENLAVIPRMGATLFQATPDHTLHRRLVRLGFEDFGDPDLLSHTLLHALPLHVALRFQVPLVLLGENSAFEYGGDADIAESIGMTRAWFDRYAANAGHDARFVSQKYNIPFEQLRLYDFPDELPGSDTRAVFSSHFFHWDSEAHLEIALQYGFRPLPAPAEGTFRNYVGIDEKIHRIHQYFKVLKFGYGRATDHACEDIRNRRMTREQAKELVRQHDLVPLSDHLIKDFCDFTDLDRTRFEAVMEYYRNPAIWVRDNDGHWLVPGHLVDAPDQQKPASAA
jgi:N-acetyl sugar amidotransferase